MGKFRNKLYKFMYGRYGMYGTDKLNRVLTYVYFAFIIIGTIVGLFIQSIWFYLAYYAVITAMLVWIFFRMFSKNIVARRRENERFCNFWILRKNKRRDRKTHIYRKCPACKAVLRLPRAKGKHTVVCPNCKNRFDVKCR